MNEQDILIEELRAELRRAILILRAAKYIVNADAYDRATVGWEKKAANLVEDIDMFVTKAE